VLVKNSLLMLTMEANSFFELLSVGTVLLANGRTPAARNGHLAEPPKKLSGGEVDDWQSHHGELAVQRGEDVT
jgi:hypothetical protein